MNNILILDIEASGFSDDSYPIEFGWIGVSSDHFDHFLVRPDDSWHHWDELAAMHHGLTLSLLNRTGVDIREAVDRLESAFVDARVYSDAIAWDQFWTDKLYATAKRNRSWVLNPISDIAPGIAAQLGDSNMLHRALTDAELLSQLVKRQLKPN